MIRHLIRALAALVFVLCLLPVARAQAPAETGAPAAAEKAPANPVPAMTIAFVSTALILFIICKPARKI